MIETPQFYREINVAGRALFRKEFEARHNFSFWKSEDVPIIGGATLQPRERQYLPVAISSSLLAHFRGLPIDNFSYLNASTRSRYAQVGIDVFSGASQEIVETIPTRPLIFPKDKSTRLLFQL